MTWRRLEGGNVDPEMTLGLTARVADPLWLLARQWQVGEFHGEDAATPVFMSAVVRSLPITGYRLSRDRPSTTTSQFVPLEAIVESEPVREGPARFQWRVEAGQRLEQRLRARAAVGHAAADALVRGLGFGPGAEQELDDWQTLDPVGTARLRLRARRCIDGARIETAIEEAGGVVSDVPVVAALTGDQQTVAVEEIEAWQLSEGGLYSEPDGPSPAWVDDRLEYRFTVEANDGVTEQVLLSAEEYPGGNLDWYHFSLADQQRKGARPTLDKRRYRLLEDPAKREQLRHELWPKAGYVEVLASPVRYAGQPAARWWELEDGDVSFGDLNGGPEDLARSVIASFGAVAGDDWFMIPVTVDVGTLNRIETVEVIDDFGDATPIESAAVHDLRAGSKERAWRFFELDGDRSVVDQKAAPLLLVPPVMDVVEQSRPMEAVAFRRDELANMAWGIERRVESPAGRPVDRDAAVTRRPPPEPDVWDYTFMTDVPASWIPLVPVRQTRTDGFAQIVLRRGRIARTEGRPSKSVDGDGERAPRSVLLGGPEAFILQEEEVPTGGIRVTRRYQMARDHDGRVHLWVGRKKSPAGGPMRRTPLRFDHLRGW